MDEERKSWDFILRASEIPALKLILQMVGRYVKLWTFLSHAGKQPNTAEIVP